MRILIVSNSPWRKDNSFGNSYTNIFEGLPNLEIANVYCKFGRPQTQVVSCFFQISDQSILKSILKHTPSGQEVFLSDEDGAAAAQAKSEERIFNKFRRHKGTLMFWARAMLWKTGKWKSQALLDFLDDFKPELLFIPIYHSHYLHDINQMILKRYNIPALGYVSDDVYSLRQFSLSPFFWIDRLVLRPKLKKIFQCCKTVYVISDVQKREYTKIFGDKFKILTKCADFSEENKPERKAPDSVLKILYAGNVSRGRYAILKRLVKEIAALNAKGQKFFLDIYTSTPLSDRQQAFLNQAGSAALHPPVDYATVQQLQGQADILLHAEAFDLHERLAVHQSFSTKIVDYLASNRCILAIGAANCASIRYFLENGCGEVASLPSEIAPALTRLYENPSRLYALADKAWRCGQKYHSRTEMQTELYTDIQATIQGVKL